MEKSKTTKGLLTLAEIALFLGACYAAHKGGQKAAQKRKEAEEKGEEFGTKEVLMCHIPTAIIAGAACATTIANYKLTTAEMAALTASAAYLTKNRDTVERKLREVVGDEKVSEFKEKMAVKNLIGTPKKGVVHKKIMAEETGYGDQLVYDLYSGRMFRSSIEEVDKGINAFKRDFEGYDGQDRNPVCYNELFAYWNIRQNDWGEVYGWSDNDDFCDSEITFQTKLIEADEFSKYNIGGYEDIKESVYLVYLNPIHYPISDWMEL